LDTSLLQVRAKWRVRFLLLTLVMHHFPDLSHFCINSRRFSHEDKEFIASKTKEWLTNDIIE